MATDLGNKGIPAAPAISNRTVTNHVASILVKLGVESRVAAATYAVWHRLADEPAPGHT